MKRQLLATLIILILSAGWSTANGVEVSSNIRVVDPHGSLETVGMLSVTLRNEEFGKLPAPSGIYYYTLIRIQLTQGVHLVRVGGLTKAQISPANYIPLALEWTYGAPAMPLDDYTIVRLIRFDDHYLDILFTYNMMYGQDSGSPNFSLDKNNAIKFSLGVPAGVVPNRPLATQTNFASYPPQTQFDTTLQCDFSASESDFSTNEFWEVGFSCYYSDAQGTLLGPYGTTFQPARLPLAQTDQTVRAGDVNRDGEVNATDLVDLSNYLAGNEILRLAALFPAPTGVTGMLSNLFYQLTDRA